MRGRNNVTDKGQGGGLEAEMDLEIWEEGKGQGARGAGPSPKLRLARPVRLFSQGFPKSLAPSICRLALLAGWLLIPASGAAIQRLLSMPCAQAVCYTRRRATIGALRDRLGLVVAHLWHFGRLSNEWMDARGMRGRIFSFGH